MSALNVKTCLAGLIVVGFLAVLIMLGLGVMSFSDDGAVPVLVGGLSGAFMMVVGWYFGSSEGSARKTEILTKEIN